MTASCHAACEGPRCCLLLGGSSGATLTPITLSQGSPASAIAFDRLGQVIHAGEHVLEAGVVRLAQEVPLSATGRADRPLSRAVERR